MAGACRGGTDAENYCETGYRGKLCSVCDDDYYHEAAEDSCVPCTKAGKTPGALVVYICTFAFVLVVVLCLWLIKTRREKFEEILNKGVEVARRSSGVGRQDEDLTDTFDQYTTNKEQANTEQAKTGLESTRLAIAAMKNKIKITWVCYQLVSAVGFNCDVSPQILMRSSL